MFVTWFQCVVAVVACYVLGNFREASPAMNMFPTYKYDWAVAKQVRNSVFLWLMRVWEGDAAQHCLCGNDCFQQPLPEERRRCFLQCWSITDDHLQCGMRYRHLNLLMLWTPGLELHDPWQHNLFQGNGHVQCHHCWLLSRCRSGTPNKQRPVALTMTH